MAHPVEEVLLGLPMPWPIATLRLHDADIGAHPTPRNGHVMLTVHHFLHPLSQTTAPDGGQMPSHVRPIIYVYPVGAHVGSQKKPAFRFIDLFAGIGGFHAALSAMGGECVYAVEIDPAAAAVYERNWGLNPLGDVTADADEKSMNVPAHDVLVAGFPCQPFSKSGAQRGMDETRGTLYWNILKIIQAHHPKVVLLENVRNLAGPRHMHEWQVIIETLRAEGYRVSETPAIFSPHLLPPDRGGRPQVRERVFIGATYVGKDADLGDLEAEPLFVNGPINGWDPKTWHLESDLPLDADHHTAGCQLSETEMLWINAWNDFVVQMWEEREGRRLPGFPLWADEWVLTRNLEIPEGTPSWKADHLRKNAEFYTAHRKLIDRWTKKWGVYSDKFPASRRKLEWQAQDTPRLWDTVMHFRPSGIRAKAPTYLPALVAITQTSIIGSRERRLSPREAARLQGLPDWFDFGPQSPAATYRQLGNGVSVGAVWFAIKSLANRDEEFLKRSSRRLLDAILTAPNGPDIILGQRDK
jgi:DNA (cytosine-5)-methyltransferase 1